MQVSEVLKNVKAITLRNIQKSLWLNKEEKEVAEKKIYNMDFVLGISNGIKNLSVLNSYYQKVTYYQLKLSITIS